MNIYIYGRGNIGTTLIEEIKWKYPKLNLLLDSEQIPTKNDIVLFAKNKENTLNIINKFQEQPKHLFDFTGAFKKEAFENNCWNYVVTNNYKQYDKPNFEIAGCIATAIIELLLPIRGILKLKQKKTKEPIYINVFLGKNVQQKGRQKRNLFLEINKVFEHNHEYEIKQFLDLHIKIIPILYSAPSGIIAQYNGYHKNDLTIYYPYAKKLNSNIDISFTGYSNEFTQGIVINKNYSWSIYHQIDNIYTPVNNALSILYHIL